MKLLLLLSSLVAVHAGITKRDASCDGPVINGVHYTDEILQADLERPYALTPDLNTNTLYFSVGEFEYKTAKIDLTTKELTYIDEDHNALVQCVDQKTSDVYLGGDRGIFKYNKQTDKAELFAAKDTDVWGIFYKDNTLYFTEFPTSLAYTIVDGEVTRFKDLEDTQAKDIVIDNDDNVFFTNDTGLGGLYSQKKGTKDAVFYEGSKENVIRGVNVNARGDVFAALKDGIYAVNKEKHAIEKVLDVTDCAGVAFDVNNKMIYCDLTSIHRLQPSDNQDCVEKNLVES